MKKALLIFLFLLILVAIPLTVFLVKQQQDIRQRAAEPASRLYLEPGNITKNVDDTFTFDIKLDTQTDNIVNNVFSADVTVTFDPIYLEALSIVGGTFLPDVLISGQVDNQAGTASIGLGAPTSQISGVSGVGEIIATVTFKAKANTPTLTLIDFSSDTEVNALTGGTGSNSINVLVAKTGATVTIGTTASPSPSSTPGGSPTPSATPGASPSPSVSPSATPTTTTKIIVPANGATVNSRRPPISGTTFPSILVLLTIDATPAISASLTSTANGSWSYTPTTDLPNRTYTVRVTADNPSGDPETVTSTFTVSVGGSGGTGIATPAPSATPASTPNVSPTATPGGTSQGGTATDSGIPVSGTTTPTVALLFLAILLISVGSLTAIFRRL